MSSARKADKVWGRQILTAFLFEARAMSGEPTRCALWRCAGDTITLYLTVKNGKVARMRHVQNGKLLVESNTEGRKREILLYSIGSVLKTDLNECGVPVQMETLPPSARLPQALRRSIRLVADWFGPQAVVAQANTCVSEIAQAMDAAARIAGLGGANGGLPGMLAPPLARLADAIAQYSDATRRLAELRQGDPLAARREDANRGMRHRRWRGSLRPRLTR